MRHTGFERVGPCPDTREDDGINDVRGGGGSWAVMFLDKLGTSTSPLPPMAFSPRASAATRLARGSKSPAGSEGQAMRAAVAALHVDGEI
jgi:hypothetical protein